MVYQEGMCSNQTEDHEIPMAPAPLLCALDVHGFATRAPSTP